MSIEHKFAGIHRTSLFRYRPSEKHDLNPDKLGYLASVLRDRIIYVPTIGQFNDPWDTAPSVSVDPDMSDEEIVRALRRDQLGSDPDPQAVLRELEAFCQSPRAWRIEQMRHIFARHTRQFAVLCLSNDPTTPLLWSYYAGGHSGYVIEFDAKVKPIAGAVKVTYDDDFPSIDPTSGPPPDLAQQVLFVKGEFWRHEREWRLLVPTTTMEKTIELGFRHMDADRTGKSPPPGVFIQLPEGAVRSVMLGIRMQDKRRRKILDFIERSGIQIRVYDEVVGTNSFKVARSLNARSPIKETTEAGARPPPQ